MERLVSVLFLFPLPRRSHFYWVLSVCLSGWILSKFQKMAAEIVIFWEQSDTNILEFYESLVGIPKFWNRLVLFTLVRVQCQSRDWSDQ